MAGKQKEDKLQKDTGERDTSLPEKSINPPAQPDEQRNSPQEADDDDGLDFGGLPKRDLKKNLGCGG